jgi:hypothetical protein
MSRGVFIFVLLVLMLVGWITYFFDWDPLKIKQARMPDWWYRTVFVTHEDGNIYAHPDPLIMGREDMVRWENLSGMDFKIEFENPEYPFAQSKFPSQIAKRYQRPKTGTPLDKYKYSVIFGSDTLDPIIKVEEDPPPGGDSSGFTP